MLHRLTSLFEGNPQAGRSRTPRRKAPAARPHIEVLDRRELLTTGFTSIYPVSSPLAQYYNNLRIATIEPVPVIFSPPNLVGHHVGLTGPGGALQGTVTFTSQNGYNFQGTYQSNESFTDHLPTVLADSYTSNLNIGPIPISGTLTFAGSSGGVTNFTISLSGMGSGQGMETRTYQYLNSADSTDSLNGTTQHETWNMVQITQSVTFSGTLSVTSTATTVFGNFNEQDTGQWHWSPDRLLSTDPNHTEFVAETTTNTTTTLSTTLDSSISKTVPVIQLQ
jgi:hypothetical protein